MMTTSGSILIFVVAFLSTAVGLIIGRIKGAKQSKWLAIYFGVAGAIFLVLGFLGLVARGFEGVTGGGYSRNPIHPFRCHLSHGFSPAQDNIQD